MSVHGEFARALERVIDAFGATAHARGDDWLARLEGARLEREPNLSSAARMALDVCSEIRATPGAEQRISEVADHLDQHCRAILGLPPR